MKLFYKQKYLIAIYDKNDNLINVFDNPKQLNGFYAHPYSLISHIYHGDIKQTKIHLINCTDVTDDCFKQEDEIFNEIFKDKNSTNLEKSKALGISVSTYYKHKKVTSSLVTKW